MRLSVFLRKRYPSCFIYFWNCSACYSPLAHHRLRLRALAIFFVLWMVGPFVLIFSELDEDSSLQKSVYDVESANNHVIINLILKRLKSSTETMRCSHQQYSRLLGMLGDFEPLKRSVEVPVTRLVRVITSTVDSMVSDVQLSKLVGPGFVDACMEFFNILQIILESVNSIEAMREAIRSGLLSAFVGFSPYFRTWFLKNADKDTDGLKSIISRATNIITATIPKYMVYSSVLLVLRDAYLNNVSDHHMSETMVGKDWNDFRSSLYNKLQVMFHDVPHLTFCDNLKHDIYSNPETIMQCSGCGDHQSGMSHSCHAVTHPPALTQ
ncbi:hypothetical protein BDQ17DRAFT_1375669 [Cyathus striatus]|nr:hypothetical protein BDQ17DRAFT_1375669 [Cyathus striatus]